MKLKRKFVAKPWGQDQLPQPFAGDRSSRIGEIWFEPPTGITPELMVKYLFTSDKLSIQVHPNDRQARKQGFPRGKEECWYILDAEPEARLGIGLTKSVSTTKLHAAVACGQMENLIDWRPVQTGDVFYVPAGTIHAIGPGITLVEIQQNVDVTYRLYDYGRPRELHLEEAIEVATPAPYDLKHQSRAEPDQSAKLVDGPQFRLFQVIGDDPDIFLQVQASEWHVVPLEGKVTVRGKLVAAGECGLCTRSSEIDLKKNVKSLITCTMKPGGK